MAEEERRQTIRELGWLFHMESMTSIGEDEWLDMWQPFQEQLLPLAKSRVAMLAENSEDPRYGGIRVAHQMSFVGSRSDSL